MSPATTLHERISLPFRTPPHPQADLIEEQVQHWTRTTALRGRAEALARYEKIHLGQMAAFGAPYATIDQGVLFGKFLTFMFNLDDHIDRTQIGGQPDQLARLFVNYQRLVVPPAYWSPPLPPLASEEQQCLETFEAILQEVRQQTTHRHVERFLYDMELTWHGLLMESCLHQAPQPITPGQYAVTRVSGGYMLASFSLIDAVMNCPITAEELALPVIRQLNSRAAALNLWLNDIYSCQYEVDQSLTDTNLVWLLSNERRANEPTINKAIDVLHAEANAYHQLEKSILKDAGSGVANHFYYIRCTIYGQYVWLGYTERYVTTPASGPLNRSGIDGDSMR
ncbi:terpene synthase family protein [Streptomyces beigongshangae]|uniref:terpene synthase family protein n=1 Tax=Streptomyces beigongshangae TaxID=2841597 RepID=UPI001C865045|nr:terpene synthase family protein [Streptomyces sp. REN17]